jgi:hypothetical protein
MFRFYSRPDIILIFSPLVIEGLKAKTGFLAELYVAVSDRAMIVKLLWRLAIRDETVVGRSVGMDYAETISYV